MAILRMIAIVPIAVRPPRLSKNFAICHKNSMALPLFLDNLDGRRYIALEKSQLSTSIQGPKLYSRDTQAGQMGKLFLV